MKIDLHCHTKAVRRGELATRNVTKELFAEKISEANVKIVAITNHDLFDRTQFEEFREEVGSMCSLWPGIEFNVNHDGERYHMIAIGSPNKLDEFETAVANVTAGKTGNFDVDVDAIITAFGTLEILYLPHFGNKTPGISEKKLEDLHTRIPDKNRTILEDSNSRSTTILTSHGMRTITGSDIQDWNEYQKADLSELRIPVDTFEHFCLFLDRDPTIIKTLLDKSYSKQYVGKPNEKVDSIRVNIPLYNEVNIIFGDKGTGKSQIIDSIRMKMEADGLSVSTYVSSEKDKSIKELTDPSDMERSAEKLDLKECEESFDAIRNWGDENIELLQTFIRYGESKDKAANKDRIKFIEQQILPYDEDTLKSVKNDLGYAVSAIESIDGIDGDYLDESELEDLQTLLEKLRASIKQKRDSELIEKNSCRLLNFTTKQIRSIVASKTGTVAKPTSTGFYDYAKNRIALYNHTSNILQNLVSKSHKEHKPLGNIGDKGDLFIESRWKMYDADSRHPEYSSEVNITSLKDSLAVIKNIRKHSFSDDPQEYLDDFQDFYDCGVVRTGVFVGTSRYVVDDELNEYTPSNGERAIVMIQRALDKDAEAYLLDEPELSLGGTYIDKTIRPKITKLGKAGKVVFIATHNANIAVRTLPYNTIYRYHDKSGYKTYLGNPFTNKLINIDDSTDEEDWKEVSMRVLEGGEDAFSDRGEIYEAGRI